MQVTERARTALVPLLLALAATLPLLARGPSCGHDFDFHLQSWLAVRGAWHAGLPVPHWVPAANYGAGEPRFIFYPPLTWLLGAALGLVLPWVWVPAAFTAICFAGAAAAMQRVARRFCAPVPAAAAATLYTLSPYLLFTGYERTAYGELLAAAWMPLLLGALLRDTLSIARVALLLAALWYTNAPAAVMGCYFVLLAVGWRAARHLRAGNKPALRELAAGAAALVLGCAVSADYLLPAWYEQRFVAIRRAIGPGMQVDDSFLFKHTGAAFHDQVLHTASWIAVVTFAAAAVAFATLLPKLRRRTGGEQRSIVFPTVLVALSLLLQFPFTAALWHHLPELAFLQFPWRLLLPASAAAALLWALALPVRGSRLLIPVALVLYAAGLALWTAQTRYQPCDDEDNVPAQLALLHAGTGFEGTDEYAALGTDNGEIQQGLPPVRILASASADEGDDSDPADDAANPHWKPVPQMPGTVQITQWGPEMFSARLRTTQPAFAVLRLERYPAWQVLLNGQPCAEACVARDDGLLTVALPANRTERIAIRYRATWDVRLGRAFTLTAAAVLLSMLLLRRRAKRTRTAQL